MLSTARGTYMIPHPRGSAWGVHVLDAIIAGA